MATKKKTEDTSETTASKTPRKRATKTAIESEVIANDNVIIANEVVANEVVANEVVANEVVANEVVANEVVANEVVEVNETLELKEVKEVIETKEVNEATSDKPIEIAETPTSVSTEVTQSNNLETIETTTNNNQTDTKHLDNEVSANNQNNNNKKRERNDGRIAKKDIDVQKKFYERLINDKVEVSIQLGKLKIDGIITYEDSYSLMIKSKFGEQMLYKQGISFISAKKAFVKRPFIKRDRPFFNNRENTDNQVATGQEDLANRPRFTNTHRESSNSNITQTETNQSQQASEQPIRRPNESRPLNRYQNQPPKTQSKPEPQKDAREVKVYKIVCAPPVKPKK
jgi:sRNA-binding regulator protein Hfq